MNRPSKKDIKSAVAKLKETSSNSAKPAEQTIGKLTEKKSSQRIRKQGI